MALSKKILSPTRAPAHGDIAPYFFSKKIFRSDGGICVSMASFCAECWVLQVQNGVIETHIPPSDRNIFSKKKYGAISP